MKRRNIIIIVLLVIAMGIAAYFLMPNGNNKQKIEYTTAQVSKQRITQSITATGTVEPVTQVEVGTQVSGILTSLYVDYNSVVKKGEVIAELDKSTLLLELNNKKNNVLLSKSKYDYELANYTRVKTLFDKNLIADSEYEQALYSYETAKNNLAIAENDLKRSETNLGYATIYSPIDGVVLSRSVEEGQTVASSFNTPTLFTIAADLKDMRVIANVDEADIGNVQEGQKVKFTVDAYPDATFEGAVTQIRQEAIIENNVVTYEVVISAANPDLKLKPGLTANIEVYTLDVMCAATVPAAALTFVPPVPPTPPADSKQKKQRGPKRDKNVVWVKNGDSLKPIHVKIGVSNGITTEVEGVENETEVIIGAKSTGASAQTQGAAQSNPFMPKRPGGNKK